MELVIWWIDEINGGHIPFMCFQISLAPFRDDIDLIGVMDTNG